MILMGNKPLDTIQLREKLSSGLASIGSWMQIANCEVAEIMSLNNFDWISLDLEHGFFNAEKIPNLVRTLELNKVLPFVRIAKNDFSSLRISLESGIIGIIHANVESASQIEQLIKATIYPPNGTRGLGFSRYNSYGEKLHAHLNRFSKIFNVVMIESDTGVKNLVEIFNVEGIDAVLIGPFDLSLSLGVPGEFDNPLYLEKISYIYKTCNEFSIPCGTHIVDPNLKMLKEEIERGGLFIPYTMDSVLLSKYSKIPDINTYIGTEKKEQS
jgi:2-dehydro-3-deoxyglucarate aldolase